MFDEIHDECGVFGIYSNKQENAKLTMYGLFAIQHRGQESAGIATTDGYGINYHKDMGLVSSVFKDEKTFDKLKGNIAIGHVRYSTTGDSEVVSAQPLVIRHSKGDLAIAHNGNLVNTGVLKQKLEEQGSIFQTSNDTEAILHLIARSLEDNIEDSIVDALGQVKGAYSILFMTNDKLIAIRDPLGIRPLVIGKIDGDYVFASETPALDLIDAEYIREVEPGEMVVVDSNGLRSEKVFFKEKTAKCIFELIYFGRPDSNLFGRNVYLIRKEIGKQLAREHKIEADIVIPVPDSGISAAIGYAEESGIPFEKGIMRNHYVGRTFIQPTQLDRELGVKKKLSPIADVIKGKKVIVIDDSIVRGTTSRKIVKLLKKAGAKEVNMLIAAPPVVAPCYYGIDMPTRKELIAATHTLEETKKYILADYLGYLSVKGMHKAIRTEKNEFCDACFTGKYPIKFPDM
ncbi:amidophosphoribosyltransferase [Haliovirga abyssi]|uniref:Amidophosphoribosyltransferase n=1 Tax=Haliovirga abyssi TaxID=2996794 RepID=A0AAU9DEE9_9FUSO|nr:amidophosphoribosyltransferase [Haliovirga abyssi]BDU50717.1 amidophosphoribosyltransferase [Haliovirga abyssi]